MVPPLIHCMTWERFLSSLSSRARDLSLLQVLQARDPNKGQVFGFWFLSSPEDIFFPLLLEREEHRCEREALVSCLPYVSGLGINPAS